MRRPRLRSGRQLLATSPPVLISREREFTILPAEAAPLIPLLDGTRTRAELVKLMPRAGVKATLDLLAGQGLLLDGPAAAGEEFWDSAPPVDTEVNVIAAAGDEATGLATALAGLGLRVSPRGRFTILHLPHYLDPSLPEIAADHARRGIPLLFTRPYGQRPWVGPLLVPDHRFCVACSLARLADNGHQPDDAAAVPASRQLAQCLAALEAGRFLRGLRVASLGAIVEFDLAGLATSTHPMATACRHLRRGRSLPMGRLTGVIEEPTVMAEEGGFRVLATRSTAIWRRDGAGIRVLAPAEVYTGKGLGTESAIASCLGEAAERLSLYSRPDLRTIGHRPEEAFDPPTLLLFSDEQYRRRPVSNRRCSPCNAVPEPWAGGETRWIEGHSLSTGAAKFFPLPYVCFGYGDPSCGSDSNGVAAGLTYEHAQQTALLELIERDAFAIWWYNRLRRPAIPLTAWGDPRIHLVAELFARRRRSLHLLDLTTDLQVPAYVAVSADWKGRKILFGSAAHTDPQIAAWQAYAEVAKNVLLMERPRDADRARWWRGASLAACPFLVPDREMGRPAEGAPLLTSLGAAGLEAWHIDMKHPDYGIPVSRVIVPGLRHWWPRFAPGRLFEVPVKMGWRESPLREVELNPYVYFG